MARLPEEHRKVCMKALWKAEVYERETSDEKQFAATRRFLEGDDA